MKAAIIMTIQRGNGRMSPTKTTLLQLSMRAERVTELLAIGSDGNKVPLRIMDDFVVLLKKAVDQYLAERAAENN